MKYTVGLTIALVGVWLLWSGHYTGLLLSLGAVSCLIVLVISARMNIIDREGMPLELPLRLVLYLPWLFWEIAKANFQVAALILNPRLPISPRLIKVRASQAGEVARVIYANSITLTPGTVSIETEGDVITVHALTAAAAEGVQSGEMDRRVKRLEGGG